MFYFWTRNAFARQIGVGWFPTAKGRESRKPARQQKTAQKGGFSCIILYIFFMKKGAVCGALLRSPQRTKQAETV
jgi:hypothetical protein